MAAKVLDGVKELRRDFIVSRIWFILPSGSEEEARGESDQELVIRKSEADVKSTKKGTNHRSSHEDSPESLSAYLQLHKHLNYSIYLLVYGSHFYSRD